MDEQAGDHMSTALVIARVKLQHTYMDLKGLFDALQSPGANQHLTVEETGLEVDELGGFLPEVGIEGLKVNTIGL